MKWLVTGAHGMLGTDLVERLRSGGFEVRGVDSHELDITDPGMTGAIRGVDVIVNCAAHTAVDAAETEEDAAFRVNAVGPQLLARAAREAGAVLVQISTDYVFGGEDTEALAGTELLSGTGPLAGIGQAAAADPRAVLEPHAEDEPMAPISAYGRTKAAGEWAVRAECPRHYVVRTAWLYGAHGRCFPRTMAGLARTRDALTVVADQYGQPTWTADLADLIVRLVESGAPFGTYHGTSSGAVSWFGFTREIVRSIGLDPSMVTPTTAAEFARPAPRPANSVLGHGALERAGIRPIGPWDERWREASAVVLA